MRSAVKFAAVTGVLLLLACGIVWSQEGSKPGEDEMKTEVPALKAFHTVVFKIWHTAWPAKDVGMLRQLLPEVKRLGDALCTSELPGILREKKDAWILNTGRMKAILAEYQNAADSNQSDRLLMAAERLHGQYESMVRLLRPVMQEVDDVHAVLYPLYHYYLPKHDGEQIRQSAALLGERMTALSKAALPSRWKDRQEAFDQARLRLGESVKKLQEVLATNQTENIDEQVKSVHSRYEDLARVFE